MVSASTSLVAEHRPEIYDMLTYFRGSPYCTAVLKIEDGRGVVTILGEPIKGDYPLDETRTFLLKDRLNYLGPQPIPIYRRVPLSYSSVFEGFTLAERHPGLALQLWVPASNMVEPLETIAIPFQIGEQGYFVDTQDLVNAPPINELNWQNVAVATESSPVRAKLLGVGKGQGLIVVEHDLQQAWLNQRSVTLYLVPLTRLRFEPLAGNTSLPNWVFNPPKSLEPELKALSKHILSFPFSEWAAKKFNSQKMHQQMMDHLKEHAHSIGFSPNLLSGLCSEIITGIGDSSPRPSFQLSSVSGLEQ